MTEPAPATATLTPLTGLVTVNKLVATEPFETTSVKISEKKGFSTIEQRTGLTALRVLSAPSNSEKLPNWLAPGDVVWVRGEMCASTFAKEVLEHAGVKFILIPEDRIVAVTFRQTVLTGGLVTFQNCAGDLPYTNATFEMP